MNLELAGSTAVVFGAASGLGRAIAAAFAAEGASAVLADVSLAVADAARELPGARAEVVDVTAYPAVRAVASRVRPDHLVYAVGAGSGKFGFPFWNGEKTRNTRNCLVS